LINLFIVRRVDRPLMENHDQLVCGGLCLASLLNSQASARLLQGRIQRFFVVSWAGWVWRYRPGSSGSFRLNVSTHRDSRTFLGSATIAISGPENSTAGPRPVLHLCHAHEVTKRLPSTIEITSNPSGWSHWILVMAGNRCPGKSSLVRSGVGRLTCR